MVSNGREKIEWLNYWIEDADKDKKRIILLGDSVTREIRKKLNSFVGANYAVDLIAMSYSIFDKKALEEIKHFFETTTYKYDFIIYQMGAHHGYHIDCVNNINDATTFADKSRKILNLLVQYSKNVISMSATLERCSDKKGNAILNHNEEIDKRNQILCMESDTLHLLYLDLNSMIDYEKIRYIDWCHFCEDCYEYISRLIIKKIFPDIHCINSNRISAIEAMEKKLKIYKENQIYIYGNGVRGKNIKNYLQKQNYNFGGFIVSKEYDDSSVDVVSIEQVEKDNALVIVTPIEASIWEKLERKKIDFISLSSDIYEILALGD